MDSLRYLSEKVGNDIARTVIESQVVYPKTKNYLEDEKAIVTKDFEDTLKVVIQEIQTSIDIKAVDAIKDAVTILERVEECKDSVLLSRADYLVVYKGGFDILRLRNKKMPNSGRSIFIEINSCRNELIRLSQTMRGKVDLRWTEIANLIPVFTLGVVVLFQFYQQQNKK